MKLKYLLITSALLLVGLGCTPPPKTADKLSVKTEFTADERAEWQSIAQWPELCDEDFKIGSDSGLGGLAFYPISETESIMRVICGAYAYQNSMLFYHVDTSTKNPMTTLIVTPTYDLDSKQVVISKSEYADDIPGYVLGFDTFNEQDKTITVFTKYRGVGDCGTRRVFAADKTMTLLKLEEQSCEDAEAWHLENPEAESMPEWPIIYERK